MASPPSLMAWPQLPQSDLGLTAMATHYCRPIGHLMVVSPRRLLCLPPRAICREVASDSFQSHIRCGRVVGMSNQHKPPTLLGIIGNTPARKAKVAKMINAPPVSSEDDDDCSTVETDQAGSKADARPAQTDLSRLWRGTTYGGVANRSDSSGDERARRGNIRTTDFAKAAPASREPRRGTKQRREQCQKPPAPKPSHPCRSSKRQQLAGSPERSDSERRKKTSTPPASSGEHFEDSYGFVKHRSSKSSYGRPSRGHGAVGEPEAPQDLRAIATLDAEASSSPKRPALLKVPKDIGTASLSESPPAKLVMGGKYDRLRDEVGNPLAGTPASPRAVFRMPTQRFDLGRGPDGLGGSGAQAFEAQPAHGSRRVPRLVSDDDDDQDNNDGNKNDDNDDGDDDDDEAAATCPWCGQSVDCSSLDRFSNGRRMGVRLQRQFCHNHQKQTALDRWRARRYPNVDWGALEARFAAHRGFLLGVVNGQQPSHFRRRLADQIASGRARSLKTEGNLNPGYYGPRGFNLMCDYLVAEFGDLLRKKAVADDVIAGRGSAAFIQSVLVAELAVRLIMDDMLVSPAEARTILEESKALGDVVHEDV